MIPSALHTSAVSRSSRSLAGKRRRGRGPAIVKRTVELHDGEVAITSVPGRDTRVVRTLPAAVA